MVYRHILLRAALGLGGVVLAAPTMAQAQVSPDAPAILPGGQPPAQPDAQEEEITVTGEKPEEAGKKVVCRRSVATGSIMTKRVCRTQSDWDRITAKSLTDKERIQDEREAREHTRAVREAGK